MSQYLKLLFPPSVIAIAFLKITSSQTMSPEEPRFRPVGATELSWCKAVPGGTGITVTALLFSNPPDIQFLQNTLQKLQIAHPILNSKLHSTSGSFSYITPHTPQIKIQPFDLQSTAQILQKVPTDPTVSPFQSIIEHEMSTNPWQNPDRPSDVFFASVYALPDDTWALILRLHTSACDRTSAAVVVRELLGLMDGVERELDESAGVSLGIEEYIPKGLASKPFWARGMDMLGYSLNSFRFSNLSFKDTVSPRGTCLVRMRFDEEETGRILSNCESREIKLSGLLAAAGLIASRSSKGIPDDQWEKNAVATLVDCRSILDPVLSSNHIGFYHSAVLNTHDVKGGENLWDLAKRVHASFANAKNNNKHFTDMADLNFLMRKAIENPGLTPSGALRTSVISVFEDPMIKTSSKVNNIFGLEDLIMCASVHGVGPSIAIFDTIRDGKLDCACVYPYPLHSREQMEEIVGEMKRILLEGAT